MFSPPEASASRFSTRTSTSRPWRAALVMGAVLASTVVATAVAAQQAVDEEYTHLIREYTTEEFFLTPHVDHLPASGAVPTPLDHHGYISGAPEKITYPEDVHAYMRAVADASPRVEVYPIGMSEEGREMIVVVVADEETIASLDTHKANLGRIGDPRSLTAEEAEQLIGVTKPIYYATGAIHSTETGSPEMLMELVYRLAVSEEPFVREIRDGLIFMATPVVEVDGRAKEVDVAMAPRRDPDGTYPRRLLYWGKYVAHDNNRDNLGLSLALTRNVLGAYLEYHPIVLHDLHESASYLYTSTGRGPYNAWVDPVVINEWARLAYKEVQDMTAMGVPGVYTFDFYDGWAPNYMFWIANMRNGIGRFYETQGAGDGSYRVLRSGVDRQWHRPNTPLPEVVWGIRNNVNLQQSALMIALNEVATHKEEYLRNHYRKAERSVAKAVNEGPAAYVMPADGRRPAQQARLGNLLREHGVELHRLDAGASTDDRSFDAGSLVVRMDQPYSRAADMLLDQQYYNPDDPSPYDDTGWTLGPLFDADMVRVVDTSILDARMTLVESDVVAEGGIVAGERDASVFAIPYRAQSELTTFRYHHPDLRIDAAEAAFSAGGTDFGPGTFLVHAEPNGGEVADLLDEAGREHGFPVHGLGGMPSVGTHEVTAPRVAVLHTWQSTQSEGWLRIGLDENGVPYDYISVHEIRDTPRLRDRWDVILMGPSTSNAMSIVDGLSADEPMPWQATDVTPNLGRQASTPDMRGGMELQGIVHLQQFLQEGGVFVTVTSSTSLPIHFGFADGTSVRETDELWAPGGVFRAELVDESSPLAYGYGETLGVYFNRGPVFASGGGGFRFRGGGFGGGGGGDEDLASTTARRSGRGGIGDEDRVQGRPHDPAAQSVEEFLAREDDEDDDPGGDEDEGTAPDRRTIFRFAEDAPDLLISGGLVGGDELAGAPAMIDHRVGDGHVILFSFNPFWRGETEGSYGLVFNALLHHGALHATGMVTEDDDRN